ncbi:MAG: archaeal proteasome endopeptidase complex subunit alpha [Candidatus Hydrothermarchaeota archaeon]
MQPMTMGYDRAITVFSPDGRLFQVEYAREAVKRGTTSIGIKCKDGVALLVGKRLTSRLIEPKSIEKIFQIDEHIGASTSGLVADARILIDRARVEAQINRITYNEPISVETLTKKICDLKQLYTQHGGVRPFGTALLVAGTDGDGARLFETDPSGALIEYMATAIGAGRPTVLETFEEKYTPDIDVNKGIDLALEALYHVTEGKLNQNNLEIAVIYVDERKFTKFTPEEVSKYVDTVLKRLRKEE